MKPWSYKYVRGLEHLKILNTAENRWLTKIAKENNNGCMLWKGFINPKGYGKFKLGKRMLLAHRYAYELNFGEIPKNMCVLHKCDVRNCVNPKHLFLGTQIENIEDMCKKGRQRSSRGEASPRTKLTNRKVKNIKLKLIRGIDIHKIARAYNVTWNTIWQIKENKSWKYV